MNPSDDRAESRGRKLGVDEHQPPSTAWTRTAFVLEGPVLGTAAVAGVLTAGTLIQLRAGTTQLSDPRSAALAWMLCACLVGLGLAMGRRVPADRAMRHRRPLLLLLVAEYSAMPMVVQQSNLEVPAIDRWLDNQPKPFGVAEVPRQRFGDAGSFERQEAAYMIHSTAHWQKTVHGYSGWRTAFHRQLYSDMQVFPDETSVASLSHLGVTYVVVHTCTRRASGAGSRTASGSSRPGCGSNTSRARGACTHCSGRSPGPPADPFSASVRVQLRRACSARSTRTIHAR